MDQKTPDRKPFDQAVADELRAACQEVLLRHPEIGALAVVINWVGDLNDAKITHGIWLGANGDVTSLEGIMGSSAQTLKLLDWMLARAFQLQQSLRTTGITLAQEVARLSEAKKQMETRGAAPPGGETETQGKTPTRTDGANPNGPGLVQH